MNEIEIIQKLGVVPVVVLNDAKDALPLAEALCDGGLPCAEVTFRTEAAEESITDIRIRGCQSLNRGNTAELLRWEKLYDLQSPLNRLCCFRRRNASRKYRNPLFQTVIHDLRIKSRTDKPGSAAC